MKATVLADKILYIEDMIENPQKVFDSIYEEIKFEQSPSQDYMLIGSGTTKDFLLRTENATFNALDIWYRENPDLNYFDYKLLPSATYFKRGPGEGYGSHLDYAANRNGTYEEVHTTILGYYSDPSEYEGGEIFFEDYDISFKPAAGSMLLFGYEVMHGVTEVTAGTRTLSSQFLVSNRSYEKIMGIDLNNLSQEDKIRLRKTSPQYGLKVGNIKQLWDNSNEQKA